MEAARSMLLDRFYRDFWLLLALLILLILITILFIAFYFIRYRKMTMKSRICVPIVSVVLIAFTCFFGQFFAKYYNDYVYLKTNDPIHIEGKVIGYAHTVSHDDLTVTRSWPIILIEETCDEISLNIVDSERRLRVEEVYAFLYLPNTKCAEIVEIQ